MGFKLSYIQEQTNGVFLSPLVDDMSITYFVFDTRKLYFTQNTLFIAFDGKRTDGHRYIVDAYKRGVRCFLISEPIDIAEYPDAIFLKVKDTVVALQKLAIKHRNEFNIPVVGITGSIGKTSIKEWLYQLLSLSKKIVKNPRSFNSSIGVPLSILAMRTWHEIGLFEAGPAAIGDMDPLVDMIKPTIGVFSNIGCEHSANFNSIQDKIKEKLKLFVDIEILIYCKDHKLIYEELLLSDYPVFSWGTGDDNNVQILEQKIKNNSVELSILFQNDFFVFLLPYRDDASIENAMHCISLLLYLGNDKFIIQEGLNVLSPLNMRMEMKQGLSNCTILDDNYSADLDSFILAMDFLERQSTKEKKTIILTDFVVTENNDNLYKKVSDYINGSSVQKVITIGQEIKEIKTLLRGDIEYKDFLSTEELVGKLWKDIYFDNEVILIKGARKFNLSLLKENLYERTYNTVLEVNMYGLAKNLKVYSGLLNDTTKMMVMVKASAYGAGAIDVAKMLEYNNVDYLSVAYADEGIQLRKHGIVTPIMVMNPEIPQFDHYITYDLEPEIYSLKMLNKLSDYLISNNLTMLVHLKIESGMNRLGFIEEELEGMIRVLQNTKQIKVISIFTHLASSGDQDKDIFTHQQVKRYLKIYEKISSSIAYKPMRHIVNSAGMIRFAEYHFEMVRLGAGLYGIDSYLPFQEKITTVLSFKSRLSQIKWIKKGEAVGYGRGFIATCDTRIGVVSAGYADGIPRSVSYGKYSLMIQGQKAPIIGAIAMDMCMVDLTDISNANEEDEVLIFGKDYPVLGLASAAKTISYEIFTSIAERVKRVYYY